MKNKKINITILFITMVLVLYFALKDDFNGIINQLKSANVFLLIIAILLLLLSLVFKSASLNVFINKYKKYSIKKTYALTLIGQFLNGITPFQSGGQPFQIYLLKKDKVRISDSTNAMIKDFIAYQSALILVGVLALLLNVKLDGFSKNIYLNGLIFLGFIINVIVMAILLLIALAKKTGFKLANKFVNFIFKFKLIRKLGLKEEKVKQSLRHFYGTGTDIKNDKASVFKGIFYNVIHLLILYSIPFVVFKSFGATSVSLLASIVSVAFVMLIGNFIPIPGATGGIEYSFLQFFGIYSSGAQLTGAMLIWRLITYFIPMIFGFVALLLKKEVKKDEDRVIY